MVFLNETDLIGSFVPNARISKITLRNRGSSLRESNPHVDHEREFRGNAGLGQPVETDPLFVDVDIVLKERIDNSLIGEWFGNQDFLKYIKILVIQSPDPVLTERLSSNRGFSRNSNIFLDIINLDRIEDQAFNSDIRAAIAALERRTFSLSNMTGNTTSLFRYYTETDDNGDLLTTVTFKTSFDFSFQPNHLAYFIFSYIDVQQLIEEFGLSLNTPFPRLPMGKVSSDIVIKNGKTVNTTYAYLDSNGRVWAGDINERAGNFFGVNSSGEEIILRRIIVGNSKIQDFRNFLDLEKLILNFSIVQNELLQKQILDPNKKRINLEEPKTYFSDFLISRDDDGKSRFMFSMNYVNILKDNARYNRLLFNNSSREEAIEDSAILSMKIFRRRIGGSPEAGSEANPRKLFDENQFDELIVSSGEKKYGTFQTINNNNGSLREIKRLFTKGTIPM